MFRARSRNVVRLCLPQSVLLVAALAGASSCAALFGMESATCSDCAPATTTAELEPGTADPSTADPSTAEPGSQELPSEAAEPDAGTSATPPAAEPSSDPCEAYCELMTGSCSDSALVPEQPYMNRAACLAICRHMPAGSPGDSSGNSLACRSRLLQSTEARDEPALVCEAAGRGGQVGAMPVCGSNCDAYCSFLTSVCPDRLPQLGGDCAAVCATVPDRFAFDVTTDRAGDTVQCRLWHVGVAAECTTEECRVRHCGHAVGIEDCLLSL